MPASLKGHNRRITTEGVSTPSSFSTDLENEISSIKQHLKTLTICVDQLEQKINKPAVFADEKMLRLRQNRINKILNQKPSTA